MNNPNNPIQISKIVPSNNQKQGNEIAKKTERLPGSHNA